MAYMLGYLYADGNLENSPAIRGKYVRVTSVDRSTIEKFKDWLHSQHIIVVLPPRTNTTGKPRFLLRIGSHVLYDALTRYGLHPHKSLTATFPHISQRYIPHFVRGYLDGDGCIFLETGIGVAGQKILKRLTIVFTSGSKEFLEGLRDILSNQANLTPKKIYEARRAFQLRYSTKDSIVLCNFLYKGVASHLYLARKKMVVDRYLKMRNGHVAK